jgi:carbon storage regulator CsrA
VCCDRRNDVLILPRKLGESIVIGDGPDTVTITVVDIGEEGTFVRLGIDAPPSVPIYRPDAAEKINSYQARRAKGDDR